MIKTQKLYEKIKKNLLVRNLFIDIFLLLLTYGNYIQEQFKYS